MASNDHGTHYAPSSLDELEKGPPAGPGRPSVAENITIPAHLLAAVTDRNEWTPDPDRKRQTSPSRTDSRRDFDVVRIAHGYQRDYTLTLDDANKISVGGIGRSHSIGADSGAKSSAIAGARTHCRTTSVPTVGERIYLPAEAKASARSHLRKTSLPVIGEPGYWSAKKHVSFRDAQNTASPRRGTLGQQDVDDPDSRMAAPNVGPSDDTILFTRLNSYNLNTNKTSEQRAGHDDDNADPFSDRHYIVSNEDADPFSDHHYIVTDEKAAGDEEHGFNVKRPSRSATVLSKIRQASVVQLASGAVHSAAHVAAAGVSSIVRKSSLAEVYEKAKTRSKDLQRKKWVQILFEYSIYLVLILFIYFVLIGVPLWKGAVWWLYWVVNNKFVVGGTWSITIGLAFIYAYAPLFLMFEKEPPMPPNIDNLDPTKTPGVHNTALLIPCYKSAQIIGPTLVAALRVFPASHIYVIANGNSPTPLDNTEEICEPYGVNHIWSPVGSKIVAQFVGCYAAKHFENVLLIDDDCALPANFPIVSDRMTGKVKCIGYTIKSVGPGSSKGTLCQQAQDLEYKISGLQRALAGLIGSATFPHGAISLWNTKFLIDTFHTHPGFSVSEDWFFGHVARKLGCRIKMCTAIFVETETPTAVFFSSGGSRGGFGEMTIFKQRFYRWNFFFVNGMYYNMAYIFGSWKLGFWEIGAKLFVFQEVYETLLYLLAPFVLPISLIVRPAFCGYLTAATFVMYFINVTIFNEVHLRKRGERVGLVALYLYYAPYKIVLTGINICSCYWSLYKYARYFAKRHPKVIEDEKAVEVVLRLEEDKSQGAQEKRQSRRMTITAVGARPDNIGRLSISSVDTAHEARLTRAATLETVSEDRETAYPQCGSDSSSYGRNSNNGLPPMHTEAHDFA
ncbi:hypothetical protein LTR36_002116 [Oleoguttula mirabilis]|uniref:Glycosyl transferase n=1 Tax=Oleoguttula mirabilis TaxID=1507867 RepID=A0AAV9JLQ2_9PEZI|nr:hypothetical protein LTR36_002116 [Oleoguttula mirabilis]